MKENYKSIQARLKELQRLDGLKSRFFADISHEFRTPLTLLLGQIDSVLTCLEEPRLREKLNMAFRNGITSRTGY